MGVSQHDKITIIYQGTVWIRIATVSHKKLNDSSNNASLIRIW